MTNVQYLGVSAISTASDPSGIHSSSLTGRTTAVNQAIFDAPQIQDGLGPFPAQNSFTSEGAAGTYGRADSLVTPNSLFAVAEFNSPSGSIFGDQLLADSSLVNLITQAANTPVTLSFDASVTVNTIADKFSSLDVNANAGSLNAFIVNANRVVTATLLQWVPGQNFTGTMSDYLAGPGITVLSESYSFAPNSFFSDEFSGTGSFSITFESDQDIQYYAELDDQVRVGVSSLPVTVPEPGTSGMMVCTLAALWLLRRAGGTWTARSRKKPSPREC